jgi:hypothetical protein
MSWTNLSDEGVILLIVVGQLSVLIVLSALMLWAKWK